jgi:hypothetical protein
MKKLSPSLSIIFLFAALACNLSSVVSTPTPSPTLTLTPQPLDLNHQPLYWFAPLPPKTLPGETDGSTDFMNLFTPDAPWSQASDYLQVFKLYGGWAARDSTLPQLSQAIQSIRQRGLALAVEVGPLNPTDKCGLNLEGFAGDEGIQTLQRIKTAGGDLNFIAFDEPYFNAHFYSGPQECHWSTDETAQKLDDFIKRARAVFPNVFVGDIEPLTGPGDDRAYKQWINAFKAVNGYDLAFLHIDVAWAETNWPAKVQAIEDYGRKQNVPVGIIYTGNFQDPNDEAWLSIAGERVKRYEIDTGGQPAHVIFQSWNDKPDLVLPENNPYSFTGFIKTYIENKASLGFRPDYFNGNLAYKKTVHVSSSIPGFEGSLAVDGDLGTFWNSGGLPPKWILIDLGQPETISAIRLVIEQWPAGATIHQIWGGADQNKLALLYEFKGLTQDPDTLEFKPSPPLTNIRSIKILTTKSPSWTAWREIEIQ